MLIPTGRAEAEIEIKKSRFIAVAIPTETMDGVKEAVLSVRKEHPDANHVVHASVIGKAGGGYRISLSRSVKLDMLLSYRCSYAEIPFSDQYGPVSDDRIRRNNNYLSAINLGIGIVL